MAASARSAAAVERAILLHAAQCGLEMIRCDNSVDNSRRGFDTAIGDACSEYRLQNVRCHLPRPPHRREQGTHSDDSSPPRRRDCAPRLTPPHSATIVAQTLVQCESASEVDAEWNPISIRAPSGSKIKNVQLVHGDSCDSDRNEFELIHLIHSRIGHATSMGSTACACAGYRCPFDPDPGGTCNCDSQIQSAS